MFLRKLCERELEFSWPCVHTVNWQSFGDPKPLLQLCRDLSLHCLNFRAWEVVDSQRPQKSWKKHVLNHPCFVATRYFALFNFPQTPLELLHCLFYLFLFCQGTIVLLHHKPVQKLVGQTQEYNKNAKALKIHSVILLMQHCLCALR